MVERAEHPLRRAPQLVAHRLDPVGRRGSYPLVVARRELSVRRRVVGRDRIATGAGEGQQHRRDKPGAVLAREAVDDQRAVDASDRLHDVADRLLPVVEHHQVAVRHRGHLRERVGEGVIDERHVKVQRSVIRGREGARPLRDLALAPEVEHRRDAVLPHRANAVGRQARHVVGAHDHAGTRDAGRAR